MNHRAEAFAAAALAGLCAHPYHPQGEHPLNGSTKIVERALVLGKAMAALVEAEEVAERADEEAAEPKPRAAPAVAPPLETPVVAAPAPEVQPVPEAEPKKKR